MPLTGQVFKITNPQALAFIVLGDIPPLFGFSGWSGITVNAVFFLEMSTLGIQFPILVTSATTAADGSFSIPSDLPHVLDGFEVAVALTVSSGMPLYRSGPIALQEASSGRLNLWLFPDTLPASAGITAGSVSQRLGSGLPAGTLISSSPAGLDFSGINEPGVSGISGQIQIDFGISITPDFSVNLESFVGISTRFANINVDFPTSLFESNNDVLQTLQNGLAAAAGSMNSAILAKMEGLLGSQDNVTAAMAQKFLTQETSTTFMDVNFPNQHVWGIADTSDQTIVMTADPCIGFPRILATGEPAL